MIDHIEHPDPFGPWRPDIDPVERRCRWRAFIALALVFAGPNSELVLAACDAERDDAAADRAWQCLLMLPPLQRRRLLSVWGAMNAAR